jgi:hypothetical protein
MWIDEIIKADKGISAQIMDKTDNDISIETVATKPAAVGA